MWFWLFPHQTFQCETNQFMDELITSHGYLALFLLSFLASTIVPLGSEWLLAALLIKGSDPLLSVAVATVGNTLGACTTYGIGVYGGPLLIGRILRVSDEGRQKAERFYARYGSWSLLLSWLPVLGDPLCLVGGLLRVRFGKFSVLVLSGKLARYAVVGFIAVRV
jgi:membrane protein YqaA with SNARE-associated domain